MSTPLRNGGHRFLKLLKSSPEDSVAFCSLHTIYSFPPQKKPSMYFISFINSVVLETLFNIFFFRILCSIIVRTLSLTMLSVIILLHFIPLIISTKRVLHVGKSPSNSELFRPYLDNFLFEKFTLYNLLHAGLYLCGADLWCVDQ